LDLDHDAINLCRTFGFAVHMLPEEGLVHVTLRL
jgi:hypothetical protein